MLGKEIEEGLEARAKAENETGGRKEDVLKIEATAKDKGESDDGNKSSGKRKRESHGEYDDASKTQRTSN